MGVVSGHDAAAALHHQLDGGDGGRGAGVMLAWSGDVDAESVELRADGPAYDAILGFEVEVGFGFWVEEAEVRRIIGARRRVSDDGQLD